MTEPLQQEPQHQHQGAEQIFLEMFTSVDRQMTAFTTSMGAQILQK